MMIENRQLRPKMKEISIAKGAVFVRLQIANCKISLQISKVVRSLLRKHVVRNL